MPGQPDKSFIIGSKYLALATTLPGYVFAGYVLGAAADRYWLHWPILRAFGVIFGTFAGLWYIIRLLLRDEKRANAGKEGQ